MFTKDLPARCWRLHKDSNMTLSYTDIETHNRHGQRDRSRFAERKAAGIDRRNQRRAKQRNAWGF